MIGLLIVLAGAQGSVLPYDACTGVNCRAGRECVLLGQHSVLQEPECVCITKCPDHWKPVCGSDGKSYDNHCELHRSACLEGAHISPLHPGFCKGDKEALIAREEFIEEISHWGEEKKTPIPMACFENDRNRLREFLVSWLDLSSRKHHWFSHGMTHNEILTGHFTGMDVNKDGYLDSEEMYQYISRNQSEPYTLAKADKIRELCLDALVEEGDVNMDWRLGYTEYKEILQEAYQPSVQVCKLNGRIYNDGAETSVECNGCVCACGKWVCTSNQCTQGYKDIFSNNVKDDIDEDDDDADDDVNDDDNDEDEEEEEYDEDDDPEDDPDVQEINWF